MQKYRVYSWVGVESFCVLANERQFCAHVLVACLKMSRLKDFLNWFVTAKRKSGGVNYTRAVSFGMPVGRGRKGEAPP